MLFCFVFLVATELRARRTRMACATFRRAAKDQERRRDAMVCFDGVAAASAAARSLLMRRLVAAKLHRFPLLALQTMAAAYRSHGTRLEWPK